MRKYILGIALAAALMCGTKSYAQYNREYFFWVGRSCMMNNDYQEAIRTLNTLLRFDENAFEGYFLRGIAKYNLDDLLGAEADFSTAIRMNPVYTQAYTYRAITRSRLGNYDDALQDFREAIELRPDLPGPYYSRGVTRLLNQQFTEAIDDFDKFIRQENKVADAFICRGLSYLHLKDTVRAYDNFNTAIRTNRENPNGYNRRGGLYMEQKRYPEAEADFNKAIECDSTYLLSYFNRALVYSNTRRPVDAIEDFSRVIELDSTSALTYFNRAILRTQIGDYNKALEDYDRVALYSPNNVLVYYNRAGLYAQLGDYDAAIRDYSRAIELYPDFANAYLSRSSLRYATKDLKGSRSDKETADRKIAEYRSKLNDSTFSIYADTSRQFNQLLSFENNFTDEEYQQVNAKSADIALLPLFKFSLAQPDSTRNAEIPQQFQPYYSEEAERFKKQIGLPLLKWVNRDSDVPPDSLIAFDAANGDSIRTGSDSWQIYFKRGLSQSLIKQYTSAISNYTAAIDRNPSNPFLYLNRSTTQSEMIDFVSSIDNSFQRIAIESDPANRLKTQSTRTYNYDEAIGDLNKAIKLLPDFAYSYYNRANLYCLSGQMSEALEDYTRAIELNPQFGEAYYNRGLIQIYLKDTHKGCLDMSKAGELGIQQAYKVLKIYGQPGNK